MSKLILIKHASPEVDPTKPPEQWKLSEKGRASCDGLAEKLRAYSPKTIISSTETKAIETAKLVADKLSISTETAPNLHEHDRSNVPHMRSGEFISMVELFFRRPDELVLGKETASQAENRFAQAIDLVVKNNPSNEAVAVVSHGTVLALFLAKHLKRPPFQLWRELGLPSIAILNLPDYSANEIIPRI